ncbi:uncharacterized protein LOC144159499 [Haemaphysalis longicornis]
MESSTTTSSSSTSEEPAGEARGTDVVGGHAHLMGDSLVSVSSVHADNGDGVQREPGQPDGDSSAKTEDNDDSMNEGDIERQLQEWLTEHRALLALLSTLEDLRPEVWENCKRGRSELKPEE